MHNKRDEGLVLFQQKVKPYISLTSLTQDRVLGFVLELEFTKVSCLDDNYLIKISNLRSAWFPTSALILIYGIVGKIGENIIETQYRST